MAASMRDCVATMIVTVLSVECQYTTHYIGTMKTARRPFVVHQITTYDENDLPAVEDGFGPARAAETPSQSGNKHYVANRPPLKQTAFVHLPLGAVKPRGWLKDQLQNQAEGLSGYAFSAFTTSADNGNAPYYHEGMVALAYTLRDERILKLAQADRRASTEDQARDRLALRRSPRRRLQLPDVPRRERHAVHDRVPGGNGR